MTLNGTAEAGIDTGFDMTVVGTGLGSLSMEHGANSGPGLLIANSNFDTIGGTAADGRNTISGNVGSGIQLQGSEASIIGNYIGTSQDGQSGVPNQSDGINSIGTDNTIGGSDLGDGNIIAFNTQYGVLVGANLPNAILSNSIYNNGAQGIGLTSGTMMNVPAPELSYAVESSGTSAGSSRVQVGGILNLQGFSEGPIFTIQVFATLKGVPTGQGQLNIGSVNVTTNASGIVSFALRNASVPTGAGTTFTATATLLATPGSSTSLFSSSIGVGTANEAYVANVYQLLLNRVPDPTSQVWVTDLNNGALPASVVLGIEGSTEYLNDQVSAYVSTLFATQGR